jgi:hypothetical protein
MVLLHVVNAIANVVIGLGIICVISIFVAGMLWIFIDKFRS